MSCNLTTPLENTVIATILANFESTNFINEYQVSEINKLYQALSKANRKSIKARYDEKIPKPADLTERDILDATTYMVYKHLSSKDKVMLIHYYQYQTCECEGFENSKLNIKLLNSISRQAELLSNESSMWGLR